MRILVVFTPFFLKLTNQIIIFHQKSSAPDLGTELFTNLTSLLERSNWGGNQLNKAFAILTRHQRKWPKW